MKIKFKRFTRPHFLKRIGRPLLARFLDAFQPAFQSGNLVLPPPGLTDEAWYAVIAQLFSSPEALPDCLNKALFAIDEMACPEGREQLDRAMAEAGLERVQLNRSHKSPEKPYILGVSAAMKAVKTL